MSALQDSEAMKVAQKNAFTTDMDYTIKQIGDDLYKFEVPLNREKAAFVLGKNGKTMVKIGKAAGCTLKLREYDHLVTGEGSNLSVRRCVKYLRCLTQQREGPVLVCEDLGDGDLTLLDIPQDAVGFVTGKSGNFLRQIEDEWNVLMFFADHETNAGSRGNRDIEKLAIFGSKDQRRGAELKVCSAVEAKMPGFFKANEDAILDRDYVEGIDWKTQVLKFKDDELSFALGKRGATRRKLEQAADCIVQYVGDIALFSGTEEQRNRIKQYMRWLFDQLEGPVEVPDAETRQDITIVEVPQEVVGYVTGAKRATLSSVETEYGCMMFFMGSKSTKNDVERLAIFGPERNRKGAEYRIKWSVELKCTGYYSRNIKENKEDWGKEGFSTDIMTLDPDYIGYVLGKSGVTRQKLAIAANCHLQYVGNYAIIMGDKKERQNCRDYIGWLLDQRKGKIEVDVAGREDCTSILVPENCVGWVAGPGGRELRRIEELTRTFCFLACNQNELCERLLICGSEPGWQGGYEGRSGAAKMVQQLISQKKEKDRQDQNAWSGSNNWSNSGRSPAHQGSHYNDYNSGSRYQSEPQPSRGPQHYGGGPKGGGRPGDDRYYESNDRRGDDRQRYEPRRDRSSRSRGRDNRGNHGNQNGGGYGGYNDGNGGHNGGNHNGGRNEGHNGGRNEGHNGGRNEGHNDKYDRRGGGERGRHDSRKRR